MVIDPSAAGLIASLTKRRIVAKKAINDVLVGISRVGSVMDSFTIDPSCTETIREFGMYRYPGGKRSTTDVPVKEDDHSMDALRYLVMDIYGRPQRKAIAAQGMAQSSRWG
jgi:phage terminase large subunit